MELAINVVALVASLAAVTMQLVRRQQSRQDELRRIGEDALATAKLHARDGIDINRQALEVAILLDMKDGKRDYSREQLWASVQAAVSRGNDARNTTP